MLRERKSSFELLRIVAMVMIVASHYGGWIVPQFTIEAVSLNRVFSQTLCLGGGSGNILFFLVSGYFLTDSSNRRKRIFMLWIEMLFYSILCLVIAYIALGTFSINDLISAVLPFSHGLYWFMTAYMVLMILMPWINIVVNNMDHKQYWELLVVLFVVSSIIPAIPGCPTTIISDVGFYLFIYLLGAYIRRYSNKYFDNIKLNLMTGLAALICIAGTIIVFDFLGVKYQVFAEKATYFAEMRNPFVIMFSISLFNVFKNIKMRNNKLINYISGSMVAVYFIHNNKIIRNAMWEKVFVNVQYDSPGLFVHFLMTIGEIFAVCLIIDIFRRELLEKPLALLLDKHCKLFTSLDRAN